MTRASFASSLGWTAGRPGSLSHCEEPPTVDLEGVDLDEDEEHARDERQRQGGQAQPAVVDAHGHEHEDEPDGGPLQLRARAVRNVSAVGRQVAGHRRRRVDDQEPERRQGEDGEHDHGVRAAASNDAGGRRDRGGLGPDRGRRPRPRGPGLARRGGRAAHSGGRRDGHGAAGRAGAVGGTHRHLLAADAARAAASAATPSLKARPRAA